jgi:hypothetical protein
MKNVAGVVVFLVLAAAIVTGCSSRSISNSGYDRGYYYRGGSGYVGELSELNMVGIDTAVRPTEAQIQAAYAQPHKVELKRGSAVMLIQSGALFPDDAMQREVSKYFKVGPFSGVPEKHDEKASYAGSFRLAAANGGYDYILCYWGTLESAQHNLATKTVSWVPIAGYIVPDEKQEMRIRLKMAVIDARTGHWTMVAHEPVEGKSIISARGNREGADQAQVNALKEAGYNALVTALAAQFKL